MSNAWGVGDLVSVSLGLIVVLLGLALPKNRTWDRAKLLLANGIAMGPLLLVFASPFPTLLHISSPDLLEVAFKEGRSVVWWASGFALLQLLRECV